MVNIGDSIKLRSHTFQNLFLKDREWNDDYMHTNQFQHVCLWFPNLKCRGEYAKVIFETSVSKIVAIENDEHGKPLFVRTELFWLVYPQALEKGEIELLTTSLNNTTGFDQDKRTIEELEFFEIEYQKGLFDVLERENNKYDSYKRGFYAMRNSGKWK